jgi:hypothetical protein
MAAAVVTHIYWLLLAWLAVPLLTGIWRFGLEEMVFRFVDAAYMLVTGAPLDTDTTPRFWRPRDKRDLTPSDE